MRITKTLVTTIELEQSEKKLLAKEYAELNSMFDKSTKKSIERKNQTDFDKLETLHELIQNILI